MKQDINLDIKSQLKDLKKYVTIIRQYTTILYTISSFAIFAFLILTISNAAQTEPTQTAIDEQSGTVKKLKIDQTSVTKIEQLKDQNVVVQSLFETARNNPFQE